MRIVGRIDDVEPKAVAPQIVEREVQVLADDLAFAQAFLAALLRGGFLRRRLRLRGLGFAGCLFGRSRLRFAPWAAAFLTGSLGLAFAAGLARLPRPTASAFFALRLAPWPSWPSAWQRAMVVAAARTVDMAFLALEVGFELGAGCLAVA